MRRLSVGLGVGLARFALGLRRFARDPDRSPAGPLYPLPDYGSVTFRECLAVESPEAA